MDGWIGEQRDVRMIEGWTDEPMKTVEWLDRGMERWMEVQKNGLMDQWLD